MQGEEEDDYMGDLSQFLPPDQVATLQTDLQEVLNILRIEFNYCFYCGCQYGSAYEIFLNCPGVEEEDHSVSIEEDHAISIDV